ncbi:MAG TPA: dienelactone hydrolase family protein [Parasegetibacter sp.]
MKKNFIYTSVIFVLFSLAACIHSFAQDQFLRELENSPRHQEWVNIRQGDRMLRCFVVYPEVSEKATAVLVIHENMGLNDWARAMTDQIAAAGFIAIAPDLLSGMAPNGGNTPDFPNADAARTAIYALAQEQVILDLTAAGNYVRSLPAANGKLAVAGFCWGGSQTFNIATTNKDIQGAFVFYGTGPTDAEAIANIEAPVYGFYGGNDNRVNASIPVSDSLMTAAGKKFEPVIYEGAGHGFMRAGQLPAASAENKKARDEAYVRLIRLLKQL